ncbi:MAG: TerC family protein [Terrimicrobiaceae bacterium]|nr:TerC family protein [Terrimicrobiaceae bacterium]
MSEIPVSWWVAFNVFVLGMLALDLGVFHRKAHVVSVKEALGWTAAWITLALLFNAWVFHALGTQKGTEFLTGYLIEKSLSVDNVFVFAVLFGYFAIPAQYQHRVLFWGIFGALVMRAAMIAGGAALITNFTWVIYGFAVLLILTGYKMLMGSHESIDPEKNIALRLLRRAMPVTTEFHGQRFFVRIGGVLTATPLFAAVLCIEVTDLIFAVDSIPAIFAITTDTFIIYTSNVFAILGLRSLYFALAGILPYFHFLKYGLGVILMFVGVKMALSHTVWKIPTPVSIGVVAGVLLLSVLASIIYRRLTPSTTA